MQKVKCTCGNDFQEVTTKKVTTGRTQINLKCVCGNTALALIEDDNNSFDLYVKDKDGKLLNYESVELEENGDK
jgi:hypothetical protein